MSTSVSAGMSGDVLFCRDADGHVVVAPDGILVWISFSFCPCYAQGGIASTRHWLVAVLPSVIEAKHKQPWVVGMPGLLMSQMVLSGVVSQPHLLNAVHGRGRM